MVSSSSPSSSSSHQWPPGFRFRPTDQELVAFYLTRKVHGRPIQAGVITEVDLYKCEPWDLPEKSSFENDVEWYFFSPRDKKYPNGSRNNRATEAGYWKATGKDRAVRSGPKSLGMKKTLVFYKGRAPHGQRTDWIMHEYRLDEGGKHCQDPFVVCRVFKKTNTSKKEETCYVEDEVSCWSPVPLSVAPSEPEEGQVLSPPTIEEPGPQVNDPPTTEETDESLNEFLMMMLEPEEQLVLAPNTNNNTTVADEYNNGIFDGFGEEAEMIEQLQNCLQQAPPDGDFMADLLGGDSIDMDEFFRPEAQQQQQPQPQVQYNYQMPPPDSPSTYFDHTQDYAKAPPSWKTDDALAAAYPNENQKSQPVKRFLGMLGSMQVLPASAAEYKASSSSSIHMDVHVTAVTITCEYPDVMANKMQKRRQLSSATRNLLFVFLVGSMSALFWILLMPACSRLARAALLL